MEIAPPAPPPGPAALPAATAAATAAAGSSSTDYTATDYLRPAMLGGSAAGGVERAQMARAQQQPSYSRGGKEHAPGAAALDLRAGKLPGVGAGLPSGTELALQKFDQHDRDGSCSLDREEAGALIDDVCHTLGYNPNHEPLSFPTLDPNPNPNPNPAQVCHTLGYKYYLLGLDVAASRAKEDKLSSQFAAVS